VNDGRGTPGHKGISSSGKDKSRRGKRASAPTHGSRAAERERLLKAMIECVGERGYVASTISELCARAGVSERDFHEQFADKEECLLATYDWSVARSWRRLGGAQSSAKGWNEQLEAFICTLFDIAGEEPDVAKLVCVEMAATGPVGLRRWASGAELMQRSIVAGFAAAPGPGTLPDPVARAIVGALRRIVYTRVRGARASEQSLQAELSELVPDLLAWIACYYPSPTDLPLRPPHPRPPVTGGRDSLDGRRAGGRAPGTLTAPSLTGERGLPGGGQGLPRGFVSHHELERIFDAIANLTAAHGYPALSLDEIVAEAAISRQTFHSHFDGKEDAFIATYETGHARVEAVVNQTLARQTSWKRAVPAAVAELLELLAGEPSYAHLACVDVMVAYPHMARRAHEAYDFYSGLFHLRATADNPSPVGNPIIGEAIVGGVFELLHDYVLRGQTRHLPELTDYVSYIALAPFVGAEDAWQAITRG
jgi:AcrR family transcriptional regulator